MASINATCGICESSIYLECDGSLDYRIEEIYKSWKLTHDLNCFEKAEELEETEGGDSNESGK